MDCRLSGGGILNFPHWYQYVNNGIGTLDPNGTCIPKLSSISDIWQIVAAVIEILLRIATLGAVAYVIYGGVQYVISQGEPDAVSKAKNTIISAIVGLAIAVLSATVVAFIGSKIKS